MLSSLLLLNFHMNKLRACVGKGFNALPDACSIVKGDYGLKDGAETRVGNWKRTAILNAERSDPE